jgi:hypothetical protein
MSADRNKDTPSSPQLSLLVDTINPNRVLEEVKIIFQDMFNNGDFTLLSAVFEDVVSLFYGKFPGFKACDTPYHNLRHTTDVFLAMARLIHGAHTRGFTLNAVDANVGLIAALMHDVGYMQKDSESYDSSAKLASVHVDRGIAFMDHILAQKGCSRDNILKCEQAILCTDLEKPLTTILFTSPSGELIGKMLASADLLAQTSDRTYLEKLPLLYREFKEAGTGNFACELDLIKDATLFNDRMNTRLTTQLDSVNCFFQNHFRVRWDTDADLYQEAIKRSMSYLAHILESDAEDYKSHLRRALTRTFHVREISGLKMPG